MSTYTIGALARAAGVNLETIRYYQRRGLLVTPARPPGGVRRYSTEILQQLRFIKRAQELGFSLREIRELLQLGQGHCRDVRKLAEQQLHNVEARLHDLQSMRRTLRTLILACRTGEESHCPIVATLADNKSVTKKLPRSKRRVTVRRST